MSTQQLQTALIELILHPDRNYNSERDDFIGRFELTETEKWQLNGLITNQFISKFGRDQREKRYGFAIFKNLRYAKKLIQEQPFKDFVYQHFDAVACTMEEEDLFPKFIEFLEAKSSLAKEYGISEFAQEVIKYEFYQFSINADDRYVYNWQPPSNSRLNPNQAFVIGKFKFDILAAIEAIDCECGLQDPEEFRKETTILMSRIVTNAEEEEHVTEQYEIDDSIENFLKSELTEAGEAAVPPCFDDLVEIGICVPVTLQ